MFSSLCVQPLADCSLLLWATDVYRQNGVANSGCIAPTKRHHLKSTCLIGKHLLELCLHLMLVYIERLYGGVSFLLLLCCTQTLLWLKLV